MKISAFILLALSMTFAVWAQAPQTIITAPAGNRFTHIDRLGETVIPNGRILTPTGKCYTVAPHPYGLAISKDGDVAVTANSGIAPLAITIISKLNSGKPEIRQVPPGAETDKGVLASVFMGLAISPDNKVVYVAGGQENKVFIFDIGSREKVGTIDCAMMDGETDYTHGYIGDLVLERDGKTLYAVDQIGFRMVEIDVASRKVIHNVPVGRYPFGIALSPDESMVYVANVGMYKYSLVKKKKQGVWKKGVIDYPSSAYGSKESEEGIKNDTLDIPGLGPVNSDESFSVWALSLKKGVAPKVVAKIKTGNLVGQMVEGIPAVGGASPNSIVASKHYVFVSNGTNDLVTVLDAKSHKLIKNIKLCPDERISKLRGIIPFGLNISPDGSRVYVAESGLNAIAVIDVVTLKIMGHIPTGWFPAKIKATPDGKKLIVANAKGFGSGPNGGKDFVLGPEGSYIGNLMKGTVEVMDVPTDAALKKMTAKVVNNNFSFENAASKSLEWRIGNPIPLVPTKQASPIKHIVFISKENRTYDEVMGQVKGGNGDPELARYATNVTFTNKDKSKKIEHASIMVNHQKLAEQFGISDNFYVDSDVSADGHRWLVNTYPNEWVESTSPANYGGNRSYKEDSKAPGSLGMSGASGAIYPEDYNEAGSMWDHLARHNVEYFNFGFGVMFDPADYKDTYKYGGMKYIANYPMPTPLFARTSHLYPTYNTSIPDQFRVDMFKKEFEEKWGNGKDTPPQLLTVILPNDHGAGERPDAGYPYKESYMADNDLAVGRIVEYLSHTPYWKNMAIIITEDDAQNGRDHVDAHRSLLMVISPYAKKNYVGHTHYSFGSIFKTFWNVLGLPYLNQYDATANDLADMFTDKPDFTQYFAMPVNQQIFDAQKAMAPLNEKFDWKQLPDSPDIDNPDDMRRESKEQDEWRKDK